MGSQEKSKKKTQLWKKVILHFSLCFLMGFFTGLAPTGKSFLLATSSNKVASSNTTEFSPSKPIQQTSHQTTNANTTSIAQKPITLHKGNKKPRSRTTRYHVKQHPPLKLKPKKLIIIVTPTSAKLLYQTVLLRRLATTLRLVPQPLLWIVVEAKSESNRVSEMLRKTGIMYRHVVFEEEFMELEGELNHQRNIALKHIENHRLNGIVHFAGLSNVYDLQFFNLLRDIEDFGTWGTALLGANRKKVIIEGPVCNSSQVIGWHVHVRNMNKNNETEEIITPRIHISNFAFNSSILWDPERWGRTSSVQDTSQNSIKFVKRVILEDEGKLKGIPPKDCSKIMLWRFNFHARTH